MKSTKIKGFSLAEVMIAMLILSIALAAAIPTITRRSAGTDNIWRMGVANNEADPGTIAFTGPNILIGATRLPLLSGLRSYFSDNTINVNDFNFIPKNDKLVIFKRVNNDQARFQSSHIGFYNKTDDSAIYVGRLTSDRTNLALGIGSLQNLQPNYSTNSGRF